MKDEKVIVSKTFISCKVGGAEYFDYMTICIRLGAVL